MRGSESWTVWKEGEEEVECGGLGVAVERGRSSVGAT